MKRARESSVSPLVMTLAVFVGLFLVAPILVIAIQSFSASRFLEFPPPSYSLRWYHELFVNDSWRASLVVSFEVACGVTLLATPLGVMSALGIDRLPRQNREMWMPFVLSPMIIPSIVTAVAMFLFFSKSGLTETRLGLILAHTVIALPLVVVSVFAALQKTGRSLELTARTLGAGPVRAFYTITLPLILPGVLTGAVFAFIASFDELVIAMFISGTRVVTLSKRMWDGIQYEIDPTSSAASTFIVLFTSILVLVVGQVSRWLSREHNASIGGKSLLNDRLAGLSLPAKPEGLSK